MEVLLDSSFIISCLRKNIDFISELKEQGFSPVLPREVMDELKDLRLNVAHADRVAIDLAFTLFETRKIKKMKLGGTSVDEGLIAKGKHGIYIATLDRVIKRAVPNRIVISDAKNAISIERD
ncbi:hypothetical protein KW805_01215 [Candidatus Pacearchaeota archaeon]|nr:hypothetical protein [Candidatus Pacearchaeota archaeon]